MYRYCIVEHQWKRLHGLKYRYSHSSVLAKDMIFVFGGARRSAVTLPVEVYDPVLDEAFDALLAESLESVDVMQPIGAYLEEREEVFILGRSRGNPTRVSGLDVNTFRLKLYHAKGRSPRHRKGNRTDVCRDGLVVLCNVGKRTELYTLTPVLGLLGSMAWSLVEMNNPIEQGIAFAAFYYMNGFAIFFGGSAEFMDSTNKLFIVDMQSGNVINVPPKESDAISVEGRWPKPMSRHASCMSNGRMLIFGGSSGKNEILQLTIDIQR